MATESERWRRDPTLRPVRWPGPAAGRMTLRAVAVAVLLVLAAGLLYAGTPGTCPSGEAAQQGGGNTRTGAAHGVDGSPGARPGVVPGANGPAGSAGNGPAGAAGPADGSGPAGSAGGPATGGPPSGGHRMAPPAGTVGMPIRLAENAALSVLAPGARVDLLVVPGQPGREPALIASGVLVLDVIRPAGADDPGVLYLALTPGPATRAVSAGADGRFAVLVRP